MSSAIEKLRKLRKDRDMGAVKEKSKRENAYSGKGQQEKVYAEGVKVKKAGDIKGDFTFRILPPSFETEDSARHWGYPVNTHYSVGINKKTFNCPRDINKPCPSCEIAFDLEDKKARKPYYPGYGALVWIIDRSNEDEGPVLFRMPFTMENDILKEVARADIKDIDDEEDGFDVIVSYTKEKGESWGKWSKPTIVRNSSPISENEDQMDEWLEYIMENPLNKVAKYHSYEVFKAAMDGEEQLGESTVNEETEETEEKPKTSFKKKFKKF